MHKKKKNITLSKSKKLLKKIVPLYGGSNLLNPIIRYIKMQARVYEGFKQVIPWRRK